MRFVWAVAAFVIAALMIGAGIAQRTVFQGPEAQSASFQTQDDTAYTLIDGAVLESAPGTQTLTAEGEGTVFAAYGRTADVRAWLAQTPYTQVSLQTGAENAPEIVTTVVEPETDAAPAPVASDAAAAAEGADAAAAAAQGTASPVGSDLWLDEFQAEGTLTTPLDLPSEMSVLIASDGTAPAPADMSVTWPLDRATPWAGPLIVGGALVLFAGLVLYVLGIRHVRRSRGPRRKGLPLPQTEPIDLAVESEDKGVISAGADRVRRALGARRRALIAVPAAATSILLFAGCSSDSWPQFADSPTPSPSATVIVPEGQQPPAVSQQQAERIIARVSATVAEADAAMDPALAETRLTGAALAERRTNYTLRGAIPEHTPLPAIPSAPLSIVLPQAQEGWPRSVMTVIENADDATVAPTIMLITQDDPWTEYKAVYIANLEAATEMPDLAATYVGAPLVPPASSFLAMPPEQVGAAYADLINNAENSPYWGRFDTETDLLLAGIQANKQERTDALNQTGADTASLTFESVAGPQPSVALATLESGAIVAVNVHENDTVKPTNADAVIRLDGDPGNPTVRALTGVEQSATGFTTTYTDQLFFYVPGQNSAEKIRLLGYRSNLLEAKVIP